MSIQDTAKRLIEIFGDKAIEVVKEILQTNPTIKGNSEDLVTMIIQTKAFYYQVENEIKKYIENYGTNS